MSATTLSDYEGLLPVDVARRVIESAVKQSVVLQLGRREVMPSGTEILPIVSTAPSADWVASGSRKPVTRVEWSSETLRAEEVAAVTSVPDALVRDAPWDVEGSVEDELGKAVARTLDRSVLFGDGAPGSFPSGGVVGMAASVSGPDPFTAISNAMGELEGEGIIPDGIAGGPGIGGALRAAALEAGDYSAAPTAEIFGVPVAITAPWPSTTPNAVIGGWENLLIGIRQDVNFAISTDGVLFDENGEPIVSAFQDDQRLVRLFGRFAVAIAKPLAADGSGPSTPFVGASWTGSNGTNGGSASVEPEAQTRSVGRPRKAS